MFATGIDNTERYYTAKSYLKVVSAMVLAGWYVGILAAVHFRLFDITTVAAPVAVIIAVAAPIVIGVALLSLEGFREILDDMAMAWFAAFHGFRVLFGYAIVAMHEMGGLPESFALRAGYGDIVAGMLGLIGAYLWIVRGTLAYPVIVIWNLVGISTYLVAVPMGYLQIKGEAHLAGLIPLYIYACILFPVFFVTHVYAVKELIKRRNFM